LGKVLLVHYSTTEKGKITNEDKVINELDKFFASKGFSVKKVLLESKKKLSLKEQFKQEKNLEIKETMAPIKGFDIIIIGTPIVGSLTSAPLVNTFIRDLPKQTNPSKPVFAIFSAGIMHGFELKKMVGLLSMKGIKPLEKRSFNSMFEFDAKKLLEVKQFFDRIIDKVDEQTPNSK
jgi:NAD(P)H-dependent FMN reductase